MRKIITFFFILFLSVPLFVFSQHQNLSPIGSLSLDSNSRWLAQYFDTQLKNIDVVGLGEVSHGGSEPIQFKSKMIQYLVEKKGFRTLFMELDDPMLRTLNKYLKNNSDTDKSKTDSLFRAVSKGEIFNMAEIRDLLVWIKTYNLGRTENEQVSLRGMDYPIDFYYFRDNYIDTAYYNDLRKKWKAAKMKSLNITQQYKVLKEWFDVKSDVLKKSLDSSLYQQLKQDLNNFKFSALSFEMGGESDSIMFKWRDSIMANNVKNLNSGKAIVWAHNSHISNTGFVRGKFRAKNLGQFLTDKYGAKYYMILTDYSGTSKVTIPKGTKFGIRETRSNNESSAAILGFKLKEKKGLISISQFKELNLPYNFNNISLEGHPFLLKGESHPFDTLVIFTDINPTTLLN